MSITVWRRSTTAPGPRMPSKPGRITAGAPRAGGASCRRWIANHSMIRFVRRTAHRTICAGAVSVAGRRAGRSIAASRRMRPIASAPTVLGVARVETLTGDLRRMSATVSAGAGTAPRAFRIGPGEASPGLAAEVGRRVRQVSAVCRAVAVVRLRALAQAGAVAVAAVARSISRRGEPCVFDRC